MTQPSICWQCRRLIGMAPICPYCHTHQRKGPKRLWHSIRDKISWVRAFATSTYANRLIATMVAMYVIALITTLILAPPHFLKSIITGPPLPVLLILGASSQHLFQGQWWGGLTASFLHGNLLHLVFNVFALHYLSQYLERYLHSFLVFCFLLSGITGFLLSASTGQVSVGASAGIFGILGCGLVTLYNRSFLKHRDPLFVSFAVFAVFGLLMGTIMPNTDNAGHLGGLMGGALCGILWTKCYTPSTALIFRWSTVLLCVATVLGWLHSISFYLYHLSPVSAPISP